VCVMKVGVEPRSFDYDHGRCKTGALTLSARLPTIIAKKIQLALSVLQRSDKTLVVAPITPFPCPF